MQDIWKLFSKPTAEWFSQTFGEPTQVQKESWPQIAAGRHVLVSAPTGTGKTLSAFLIFIDQLLQKARAGELTEGVQLLYISPLKSLAADIRENLRRPLDGIGGEEISAAIRTGDTTQAERQRMAKHPPHILITTPESLFLMLTAASGQRMLKNVQAVVVDELHALIDTKRGAHLLFSIARLEHLCGRRLQRIGLSATIEPLSLAAQWLSLEEAAIVAPSMEKKTRISVVGIVPSQGRRKDPVWEKLAEKVYDRCLEAKSVIAFSEGRRYAEKLAYYVNQIAGEDFARVHHGSLSKEQRQEAEESLRQGKLRLLCATSSMELGIDVGEIDEVLQIGCPHTVSSAMQRLGRAGHNPGRVSVMRMYPRTAPEGLYCGMTAALAREGTVEEAKPPRLCLDVLAQHLVSMAAGKRESLDIAYTVDEVLELTGRTWTFRDVTRETVKGLLGMLAGDYEHNREIPVRPRVLYDRIHEVVYPDPYSRMLAVAAGGTIPDKGMYAAKTPEGVKVGELDEEFVYESRIGDRFLLGAFGWRIVGQDKDTVLVEQAVADSARLPFWKGEIRGRSLKTGLSFGRMLGRLGRAPGREALLSQLDAMGLDSEAAANAADFLERQMAVTGCLPDDRTILVEHFCEHTGSHQIMIHSLFGRRVNAPLALVLQHTVRERFHINAGSVDEEDGILLYPYGEENMPEGILQSVETDQVRTILEAALPATPLFGMTFRYNAARALMMGMKRGGRQPLWMQRLRSTEMLDHLIREKDHPLMLETRRECLEDQWDMEGLLQILSGIRSGLIGVREIYVDAPSPMSLPLQWHVEAMEMYSYTPMTPGILQNTWEKQQSDGAMTLGGISAGNGMKFFGDMDFGDGRKPFAGIHPGEGIRPGEQAFWDVRYQEKTPQSAAELHELLMMEGDLEAEELNRIFGTLEERSKGADAAAEAVKGAAKAKEGISEEAGSAAKQGSAGAENGGGPAGDWLEELARSGLADYVEPGLWIAAEQREEYETALAWLQDGETAPMPERDGGENSGKETGAALEAAAHIFRRMLFYRGAARKERICLRYAAREDRTGAVLSYLTDRGDIVEESGIFYHRKLYERAQRETLKQLRRETATQPAAHFAAMMAQRSRISAAPEEQLKETLRLYAGQAFAPGFWEEVLLPARVKNYREALLDSLLAQGEYFWHFLPDGRLRFESQEDVDWEAEEPLMPDGSCGAMGKSSANGKNADVRMPKDGAGSFPAALEGNERLLYEQLKKRGASFLKPLSRCLEEGDAREVLLGLAEKGLVYADSFVPVRQSMNQEKLAKAAVRQRVNARVQAMAAGRWDLVRPCRKMTMEEWLERLFEQNFILCRETWRRAESDRDVQDPEHMAWSDALAVLRIWEYVGKVRRGYFVEGLSGAQYIRREDYAAVTWALAAPGEEILWLNAADPACVWGKILPYQKERSFTAISSTAVALKAGRIAAVLERKGRALRVWETEFLEEIIAELAAAFRGRRLFRGQKRMVMKEYPAEAAELLKASGFIREMQDYVLYLS